MPSDLQFKKALRAYPKLVEILVRKLIEGLDAMEVKTCSYQGNMTFQAFVDYPTRLTYIKAINDIAQLSVADFSASEGAAGLNAVDRIKRILDRASERTSTTANGE